VSHWRFRPIERSDFPLLAHWLRQPHVARWWADDASPAGLESDYGPVIDGTEPAEVFIVLRDREPVGLAQRLRLAAYPEYETAIGALMPVPPATWSIDYLLGEERFTGHGCGTEMLMAFVDRLWAETDACCLLVPVHVENRASWRALERAGFVIAVRGELDPDNPADSRDHFVLRIDRA
jgi:aminoglycoside 6'-N-acetyltransferase